jgi:tetratricopeptide (TPR) repeat protein
MKEAILNYQKALEVSPQDDLARNNLAWILATSSDASIRDGVKAVALAQEAVHLSDGRNPNYFRTLAASYAESNRFPEAILAAERGMEIATAQGKSGLANDLEREITLYRAHAPRRETAPTK